MLIKIAFSVAIFILLVGAWLTFGPQKIAVLPLPSGDDAWFRAELALSPAAPVAGSPTEMTFSFTYTDGVPLGDLMVHHDRRVHVVIVSEDLATFGHIHPEDFGTETEEQIRSGVYDVRYTFPRSGRYVVAVDVMNEEGAFAKQFIVDVSGTPAMAAGAAMDTAETKCVVSYAEERQDAYTHPILVSETEVPCPGGYEVRLTASPRPILAGKESILRYRVLRGGQPVTDLEAYLGAAMHLAIVPASLNTVLHRHGNAEGITEEAPVYLMPRSSLFVPVALAHLGGMMHDAAPPYRFGPDLVSEGIVFPKPGAYRIFAAFKHRGRIVLAPFMVDVH
jgi:Cu+-exporting ATPase